MSTPDESHAQNAFDDMNLEIERLRAANAELLEPLKECVALIKKYVPLGVLGMDVDGQLTLLKKLRHMDEAIAKATGEGDQ